MNAVTSLRNQANEPSFPTSTRALGWWGVLPPIDHQSQRWWLPLSDTALVAVASAAVGNDPDPDRPNPLAVGHLLSAFAEDPPLLLFALLNWPGDDYVSVTELAQWFSSTVLHVLSEGEWILAAPEITHQHQYRWSRLLARSRSLDPNEWIRHAADWLQVTGPEVDANWIKGLPAIIWDSQPEVRPQLAGSNLLQSLSRLRERETAIERSLSALAEKRKNAAAKQLAYGLSHEINNPLANISARAQQLARGETDPQRAASLEQIVQQVYRAHEMIAGLMFFANPPEVQRQRVDLNPLLTETCAEFQGLASEVDIRLLAETLADPAIAEVDRTMMLEALRILVRNAIEAIGTGGTVVISIERAEEPERAEPPEGIEDENGTGRWLIHVTDSGPGLSAESSKHAFDPFYSGREAGRGLGLGLCRAYRVAKLHEATIRLSSGLAGCVATIAIPITSHRRR